MVDRKLLERLCKIRRLARGNPSQEEGQAAEKKLQELMRKHDVRESQLDVFEGRPARRSPVPQGVVVVEINPSSGWGRIFGFGFGFDVTMTGTDTSTSSHSGFWSW